MVAENVHPNEKLTLFLYYIVEQCMGNQSVPIQIWNINKHLHRTNNAADDWNSRLNCILVKQKPNIILLVDKLKAEAELLF